MALAAVFASTEVASAQARDETGADIGRAIGATFAGLAASGVGALLGAGVGAASEPCYGGEVFCFREAMAGVGALTGAGLGVTLFPAMYSLSQSLTGGRGDTGGAYLGWLAGVGVAAPLLIAGFAVEETDLGISGGWFWGTAAVLGPLLAMIGTGIGYQLTVDRRVLPEVSIAVGSSGASLTVGGAF